MTLNQGEHGKFPGARCIWGGLWPRAEPEAPGASGTGARGSFSAINANQKVEMFAAIFFPNIPQKQSGRKKMADWADIFHSLFDCTKIPPEFFFFF